MSLESKLIFKITNYSDEDGTTWYSCQMSDGESSWTFKTRYSELREMHDAAVLIKKNQLPEFPHRKLLFNKSSSFLEKRKKQIENYFNSLFKIVKLKDLPEMEHFLMQNRPSTLKESPDKPSGLTLNQGEKIAELNKQKSVKKILDQITNQTKTHIIEINDSYDRVDNDTRRTFNEQFKKLKLEPKSQLIENAQFPKAHEDNQTEFYAMFFHDQHSKILALGREVGQLCLLKKQKEPQKELVSEIGLQE